MRRKIFVSEKRHPINIRRKKKLLSVAELAEIAGFSSPSIVMHYEAGYLKPPKERLIALAKALKISPRRLGEEIDLWMSEREEVKTVAS